MKRILFVLPLLVALMLHAEEAGVHRFANYNIRYVNASNGDTGEKLWANRREYVVRNITGYDFDIVGMEEVTGNNKDATTGKSQLQDLRDMLTGYADYSVEREGKSYSYNSIFYKTAKYTVLDKGFFYVNSHPDTPGADWGESIARTCIWLYLQDKASGQNFYFVCTHVNYGATECGIQSGKLIGNRIRALVGQTPMVLVGDFNMSRSAHEEAYRGYAAHFYDLALTAPVNQCLPADGPQITATTTEWTPAVQKQTGSEFDYIFYDHMQPLSRHIITEYYPESGRTVNPSDHYPVLGRFRLGTAEHPTAYYATDKATFLTALASATPEDTVYMVEGTYDVTASISPECSLTLSGGWNSSFTQQTGRTHFRANDLTAAIINIPHYYNLALDHIELSGGNNTSLTGGGAIYSYGPNMSLTDCYIHNNTASGTGGAVVHKGEQLTVSGCMFEQNSASTGGAVWCQNRDKMTIRDSRFMSNSANSAGGAVEALGFTILDVQRCAFVGNSATTRGALDILPAATPQSANILNCSFLGNTLNAKKGLATVTKRYGGAALWADMTETTIPLNIGLCTFMGNHLTFDGTDANFGGAAVAIYKGKVCLMDNLILANDRKIGSAAPAWNDLYTVTNDVNVWRDTYNLYSASAEIDGWENTITATFGGTLNGGIYAPQVKDDGSYPIYQKSLGTYSIACLPANQRLCESAFIYDLNGDGSISGSVTRDQLNRQRGIQSCIGAVEYTGNDHPAATDNLFVRPTITDGAIYSVTGQYMGTDINALPQGIYIINGKKIMKYLNR